jgi:CDP-diacylglycerol---glycerol-3-phosphate 3-phosphatidyltransferase
VTGSLVSPTTRQRVRDLATPVATALGRLGLTPNALTVIGFLGISVAALAAANQWWLAAGVLVLVFGIVDLFDGALARATGQTSKLGAFLDSTFDRAGEAIVYIGIAAGCLAAGFTFGALLAPAAMAASFMVSYTRAKSESLGFTPGTGMANVGVAPREVRIAVLTIGLLGAAAAGGNVTGFTFAPDGAVQATSAGFILAASLVLITILATLTTIQRMVHVLDQSREG